MFSQCLVLPLVSVWCCVWSVSGVVFGQCLVLCLVSVWCCVWSVSGVASGQCFILCGILLGCVDLMFLVFFICLRYLCMYVPLPFDWSAL